MAYSQYLTPRQEVLTEDGIEGIIDLQNLTDRRRRKLESRPDAFLDLTYPTAEIKRVLDKVNARFSTRADASSLFLFEGLKGSGKSHLLVLMYHLLKNRENGARWLSRHGLSLAIPADTVVVVHKYTDRPLQRLWDFIFAEAGIAIRGEYEIYPTPQQVEEAIGDRHLVVILDELEQGIRMISDEPLRRQNVGFLQMLSELGNRSPRVTIFGSIYDADKEPGQTLIRVPSLRIQFARSTLADRAKVVLHRLFGNFLDFNSDSVSGTVDSLLNTWQRFIPNLDVQSFRRDMLASYPFHPELLRLILERVPQRGGFQNIRGSLGFLANLVRLTYVSEDVITAGHAVLQDRETTTRLQDLNPDGDLVRRGKTNADELARFALSAPVAATTMLYTLAGDGRNKGATREELIRHVMLPGRDINDFEQTLLAFRRYASYFHSVEERFFFDNEENADAKVEFRSLTVDSDGTRAKELLRRTWRDEVFHEPENAVVYTTTDETKAALEALRKDRLRIVLAPRQLSPDERHALYFGLSVRNQVVLLEPKARDFNLDTNADLIKWAQRCLAAKELRDQAERANEMPRRDEYDRIGREDRKHITDSIRRGGLQYMRFDAYGSSAATDRIEPENVPGATKEDAVRFLTEQQFPTGMFQEHLSARLDQIKQKIVRDVDREYRETLTFPVPTAAQSVTRAIRDLCVSGRIGIYHQRNNYSRQNPELSEMELMDARIGEPIENQPLPLPPRPPLPPPPPGLTLLEVSPAGPLSLRPGETAQLNFIAYNAGGQVIANVPVGWRSTAPAAVSVSGSGLVAATSDGHAFITAASGEIVSNAVDVSVQVSTEIITIPFKPSKNALRQEIAVKLAAIEGVRVTEARFQVFQGEQQGDLSSMPSSLRGSLSGPGSLAFEITLTKRGDMTKAQIEQVCEQLPDFSAAQYTVRLTVVRPRRPA